MQQMTIKSIQPLHISFSPPSTIDTPKWKQPPTSTSSTWLWPMLWSPPPCPSRAQTTCSAPGRLARWRAKSSSPSITTTCSPASSRWPWWVWTATWPCATPSRPWISVRPSRPRSSMWSSGCCRLVLGSLPWYSEARRQITVSSPFYTFTLLWYEFSLCLTGVKSFYSYLFGLFHLCLPSRQNNCDHLQMDSYRGCQTWSPTAVQHPCLELSQLAAESILQIQN